MKRTILDYFFILVPVILLSYTQLVLKWQSNAVGGVTMLEKGITNYILAMVFNLWTITAIVAAILALGSWFVALAHFPISYAYPFLSLSFLFVSLGGVLILDERIDPLRIGGLLLIVIGVALNAKGSL